MPTSQSEADADLSISHQVWRDILAADIGLIMAFQAAESLSEQIARHISEQIISGELVEGERIQGCEQTGQSGRLGSFISRKVPLRPSIISRRPL